MRRFRLKPAAWLTPIFLILCIVGAKHIDRMIDRFIDEILSPQGNSGVRHFLDGGDEASNLYGWHNNEEFAEGGYYYNYQSRKPLPALSRWWMNAFSVQKNNVYIISDIILL